MRCYKGNFDRLLEQRELEQAQNESRRVNLGKQREQLEDFVERFGAKASKAKQAQSKAKQIEKLRELEDQIETPLQQSSMHLKLPEAPQSGRDVLNIKKFSIGYTTPLASGIDLLIERGLRIAIIGCNGIGKSTFLKTIAGQIPALEGQAKFGHNTKIDNVDKLGGIVSRSNFDTIFTDVSPAFNFEKFTTYIKNEQLV